MRHAFLIPLPFRAPSITEAATPRRASPGRWPLLSELDRRLPDFLERFETSCEHRIDVLKRLLRKLGRELKQLLALRVRSFQLPLNQG